MAVVCAVVPTGRSAANTITSVQGANGEQSRKSREKRGSGPTPCRSKDPLNMMLYQYRNSAAAHEPSASNMAAEPFVFDAGIYAMTVVEGGRLDALTGQVDISSSPKKRNQAPWRV
jgi:hypothetical protein